MGLGSSVHHDGCSELGMTPWFLSSMDVKSLSRPIPLPTPRVTWSKCGRQALSQPHPTHHSAGGLFPGVLEGRARQQEGRMLGLRIWQVAGAPSSLGSPQFSRRDTPLAQRLKC